MKVIIAENYEDGARKAADLIEKIVRDNPKCTLGLATGSSPVGMYRELTRRCREEGLDFSQVHSVNLDEYVGLDGTHDQSYRYFMNTNLFDHINIDKANTYVAKGTGDVAANLKEFNEVLDRTDIDIQVLGVGPDGHLGFNEPGETLYDGAHEETLEDSTIEANKRFFASNHQRKQAGSRDQAADRGQDRSPLPLHLHADAPGRHRGDREEAGRRDRIQGIKPQGYPP